MPEDENQIPNEGPLSILSEGDWTGVSENLRYGGQSHLRKSYRIPIDILHFNIKNGRYRIRYSLLEKANPEVIIDPTQDRWRREILSLLNGTWEDSKTGIGTKRDRQYFLQLVEDIRERNQERPGVVLETGGVMSGNRRLAALMTLFNETQNQRYRCFEAFIVPSSGKITNADLWHLEMSAQMAQTRLTRAYDPVEKILKIREGVNYFMELNRAGGEKSAIRAVATDFGQTEDEIRDQLTILYNIEQYLISIGRPSEWWLAEGLTEVFTEIGPLKQALETNAMAFEDRSKLMRSIFGIIRNDEADYRLLRNIRTSVGPVSRRRGARRMPSVTRILINAAPSTSELRTPSNSASKARANELVNRFHSEFEANKEQEAPLTKAQRAESNLQKLVEILPGTDLISAGRDQLITSLTNSKELADKAINIVKKTK